MSNVVHGSRAKVYIDNVLVGIFDSCSISGADAAEAVHLLGRFSPDEIVITAREAVNISCSGFRYVNHGKHVAPRVPKLQDLLNFTSFTMTVVDRQTGAILDTILGCVPTNNSTNYQAKATTRLTVNYMGIRASDSDSGPQDESPGAVSMS